MSVSVALWLCVHVWPLLLCSFSCLTYRQTGQLHRELCLMAFSASPCVCVHPFVSLSRCVCVCVNLYLFMTAWVCVCWWMLLCNFVIVSVCVYVCLCLTACVSVWVCVHCVGPTQSSLCVLFPANKPNMDLASALFGCWFGTVIGELVWFLTRPLFQMKTNCHTKPFCCFVQTKKAHVSLSYKVFCTAFI